MNRSLNYRGRSATLAVAVESAAITAPGTTRVNMDQTFFGLTKNPFTAVARGADVFIGPQTAGLVETLRSALQPRDAVVTVSGPAGVGKTTLVNYALDALYKKKKIVRVGRAPLSSQDVLQSLLIVLGVANRPVERELRLIFLHDALRQYAAAGVSVFVIVEDTSTASTDVLAELAKLTAANTDESAGARMVLMGTDSALDFEKDSALDKLQERLTAQHDLNSFSPAETRAYLLHCFRSAGGDFNELFAADCSAMLHKICEGNPRAINQLADVMLRTADELNLQRITTRFMAEVAARIYDPESHDFRFGTPEAATEPARNDASADLPGLADATPVEEPPGSVEGDIAKAERLEDLDDVMAETLFGAEISEIAAQATGGSQ